MRYNQVWLDYCLINLTCWEGKFYTDDWFGEIIIKLNKKKVRPSANTKSDVFLREIIALNVTSLWKGIEVLVQAIRAIWHENHHLVIDTRSDVIFMVKLIQEIEIFKIQPSCGSAKSSEFVDLL